MNRFVPRLVTVSLRLLVARPTSRNSLTISRLFIFNQVLLPTVLQQCSICMRSCGLNAKLVNPKIVGGDRKKKKRKRKKEDEEEKGEDEKKKVVS